MKNQDLEKRRSKIMPRGAGILCNFYVQKTDNATIWDEEGRAFTDFSCGIAVLNTGHNHPLIKNAIQKQLELFTHTAFQIVPYEIYVSLAERIADIVPIRGDKKTMFFSTGAEAVENAIKIARAFTGRSGLLAFSGSFHGRTHMGLALTGKNAPYKTGFGPFPSGIYHLPFPSPTLNVTVEDSIKALENLFKADIDPKSVAAVIIEPIQGEGGFYVAPIELMTRLRALCNEHGIVLIADEIQSGFGRTGKMFCMEHFGVEPDLITVAKSIAAGLPLSGVCGKAHIMDGPSPGGLGGTYAGNPLAIAAAHAVLDVLEKENLCSRSIRLGNKLKEVLIAESHHNPYIKEVRGIGSMMAIEFYDPISNTPSASIASKVQKNALEKQLLLLTCGVYGNVIRFLYPLTIPDQQFENALSDLVNAIREASDELASV